MARVPLEKNRQMQAPEHFLRLNWGKGRACFVAGVRFGSQNCKKREGFEAFFDVF